MTASREDLWAALKNNDLDGVVQALDGGADPNAGYGGWFPLGRALRHGTPEIALALIRHGANLNLKEQGAGMLPMAIRRPGFIGVVRAMLATGVSASKSALRCAGQAGNSEAVRLLLSHGASAEGDADATSMHKKCLPALALWPAKKTKEIPHELVAATFAKPIMDTVAIALAIESARDRSGWLSNLVMEHGQLSPRGRERMLFYHLQAGRKATVQRMLDESYAAPVAASEGSIPLLSGCAVWLGRTGQHGVGWETLERLLDTGWSLDATNYAFERDAQGNRKMRKDGFALLSSVSSKARPKLLHLMAKRQMLAFFDCEEHPGSSTTLAHVLIRHREWNLLAQLTKLWPGTRWERDGHVGILEMWAGWHHSDRQIEKAKQQGGHKLALMPPLNSLRRVLELEGTDPTRKNENGQTALRGVLARQHPENLFQGEMNSLATLDEIVQTLIAHGCDPLVPDNQGVTDLDYARAFMISEKGKQTLDECEAAAMDRSTAHTKPGSRRGQRL